MFFTIMVSWLMASETVYVRLFTDLKQVSIQSQEMKIGSYQIPENKIHIDFDEKWNIKGKKPLFQSKDKRLLKIESEKLRVFHRNVNNEVYLHWNAKRSGIDVLTSIPLNEYLKGVIPAEMPAFWPMEALKAQVVASKSYVLSQIKEKADLHFDVDASVMDQVFDQSRFDRLSPKLKAKVEKAIKETQGIYLVGSEEVLKAYFHSHCGGHTENPLKVWRSKENWQGVDDPYCNRIRPLNWSYNISKNTFASKIAKYFKESPAPLDKIVEGKRNNSGRLDKLFVFFKDGRIRSISSQDLRETLGFSNVKSTSMKVRLKGDTLSFKGKGYGHGVGMCQHGAKKMAKLGKAYDEILNFYYPAAKLSKMPEDTKYLAKAE